MCTYYCNTMDIMIAVEAWNIVYVTICTESYCVAFSVSWISSTSVIYKIYVSRRWQMSLTNHVSIYRYIYTSGCLTIDRNACTVRVLQYCTCTCLTQLIAICRVLYWSIYCTVLRTRGNCMHSTVSCVKDSSVLPPSQNSCPVNKIKGVLIVCLLVISP